LIPGCTPAAGTAAAVDRRNHGTFRWQLALTLQHRAAGVEGRPPRHPRQFASGG
jgi:hypothetical protein